MLLKEKSACDKIENIQNNADFTEKNI